MNLAQLVQSQNLATLLQALAPTAELAPGQTVEAQLLTLDGNGLATALIGDTKISLVLAGPEAKQAALLPGATLLLRIDAAEEPGGSLRATLVETRPPAPAGVAPATPQSTPQTGQATAPNPTPMVSPTTTSPAEPPRASAPLQPSSLLQAAVTADAPRSGAASQPVQAQANAATSPRAIAGPLLGPVLANQDGLAPLFANLRSISEGSVALTLPKPLLTLIERVLAQAVPVERRPLGAEVLKDAVQRSGLFMESRQVATSQATSQAVPPQADLKANLVTLRDALAAVIERFVPTPAGKPQAALLLSPQTAGMPTAPAKPTPPRRDGPLALQPIVEPTLAAGEKPLTIAQTLLEQTDAALDRVTLSQFASLPLDGARPDQNQAPRWLTEIPLAFHSGAAVLPLHIEKEPPRRGPNGVEAPLWRIRFALDVEPMGPLQGVVTLQGRSVGVTLWAEREETSRLLRGAAPGLEAALVDAQFENGAIDIHTGQPRVMQPTAGQFLDRMS
ncbi:flagellar hook-length control protein FliK [Bosea sp. 685]|uniref:flagellar hook-length control protein FliK n=1 Tax=Bosea sp. 685 TaxID=3080057 RepID=UPI002892E6ED|nr:flagellar hook-length control protein FliK [Bosea sp. 685]WNJ92349.1 flagellar hook-length control protein FliK [Bosea sp. 685]